METELNAHQKLYRASPWYKFLTHKRNAKSRGIPFELTFIEWWNLWQESGRWSQRGNRTGFYVMARNGDKGPYAKWNVKIILFEENILGGNIGNTRAFGCKHSLESITRSSKAHIQSWEVTNPSGERFSISNMRQFCLENNLNDGHMTKVAQGKRKHHKGWKCRKSPEMKLMMAA